MAKRPDPIPQDFSLRPSERDLELRKENWLQSYQDFDNAWIMLITRLILCFFKIWVRPQYVGLENLPREEGYLLAGNHSSAFDVIAVHPVVGRWITWVAKREFLDNKFLAFFFRAYRVISLDRDKVDVTAMKQILQVVKNDEVLGIFPQGTRTAYRERNKNLPKAGIAAIALKYQSTIVPFYTPVKIKPFRKNYYVFGPAYSLWEADYMRSDKDNKQELAKEMMHLAYGLGGITCEY